MSKVGNSRSKFAQLRALREAGKKAFDSYEVDNVENLYEEVDENQYKKIVRDRLNEDDFVVDDNGEGYADDGREEWDRVPQYESDSEDDMIVRGKDRKQCRSGCLLFFELQSIDALAAKKTREDDQAKRDANDRDISEYFTKGAGKAQPPKPKVCRESLL